MMSIAFRRSHALVATLSLVGLAVSFWSLWPAAGEVPLQVTPLLIIDRFALYYFGLIIAATFAVVLMSYGYFERHDVRREEFYVLLLIAALGSAVLVASNHFISFFLGLEILSVTLYAMSAYLTERGIALEAGAKYLILAAASAAFLLPLRRATPRRGVVVAPLFWATASAMIRLAEPGPVEVSVAAGWWLTLKKPSAICAAVCSWRGEISLRSGPAS